MAKHPKPTDNNATLTVRSVVGAPSGGRPRPNVELRPDGWGQVERAIDAAIKSGPQYRTVGKPSAVKKPPEDTG